MSNSSINSEKCKNNKNNFHLDKEEQVLEPSKSTSQDQVQDKSFKYAVAQNVDGINNAAGKSEEPQKNITTNVRFVLNVIQINFSFLYQFVWQVLSKFLEFSKSLFARTFDIVNVILIFFLLMQAVEEGTSSSSNAEANLSDLEGSSSDKDGDKDFRKKKNRCAVCRKKVGLTGNYTLYKFEFVSYSILLGVIVTAT